MENLDKKIDLKVTMGLRNEFLCKKCDIFPRPDLKLMRCSSCTTLLCQNCCEDEDDFEGQLAGEIDLLTKCQGFLNCAAPLRLGVMALAICFDSSPKKFLCILFT